MEDVLHVVEVVLEGVTALADGLEIAVDRLGHQLLELTGAAHADLIGNLLGVATAADGRRGQQARDLGAVLGIERDVALGIGLGFLDALRRLLRRHGYRDGIAVRLAHLAAVEARQHGRGGQKPVDAWEHLAVALVETARDKTRDLDVGKLVAADGHDVALAEEDVAGLMHGIGQKQPGQGMARGLLLGLDGRVAFELRLGYKRQEGQHELVLCRDGGVGEDHGLVRVDAAGQVVHDHVVHIVLDVLRGVAVGDNLVVRNDDIGLDTQVLQTDALDERAEIVPQVQATRRTVAGQHRVLVGLAGGKVGLDLVAAAQCRLVAALVWHGVSFPDVLQRA